MELNDIVEVIEFCNKVKNNSIELESIKDKCFIDKMLNIICIYNCYNDYSELKDYLIEVDYMENEETIKEGIKAYKEAQRIWKLFNYCGIPAWVICEILETWG